MRGKGGRGGRSGGEVGGEGMGGREDHWERKGWKVVSV